MFNYVWLTNHYDEKIKINYEPMADTKYHIVGDIVIGPPKATKENSTKDLELMGVYGMYEVVEG